MSSRPNNNKSGCLGLLIFAVVVTVMFLNRSADRRTFDPVHHSPGPVARAMDVDNAPLVNPLEAMLHAYASPERKPGVAAAILVDTSGSMGGAVPDSGGGKAAKIIIARRAVLKLVEQMSSYARAHPEQTIQLGVFEFSARDHQPACREVVSLSAPSPESARSAVEGMKPDGGTPIGDAIVTAKQKLDATGLQKLHIMVVTDGENTLGYSPAEVVGAMARLPEESRASTYFIAFDVAAAKFEPVRSAGGLVLAAGNEKELQQTFDYVLSGKILAEQPPVAGQ